jgi:hypothetical protein
MVKIRAEFSIPPLLANKGTRLDRLLRLKHSAFLPGNLVTACSLAWDDRLELARQIAAIHNSPLRVNGGPALPFI